jgi:predicted small secreted protein
MKRFAQTCAAAGAAALLLAACNPAGGSSSDDQTEGTSADPVYTEIASWDACEVLDNLQPITEKMGIVGWGSSTAEGGEPGNSEIGNTFDPDSLGCNGLINLGDYEGYTMSGEIQVSIIPTESEEAAAASYSEKTSAAEASSSEGQDAASEEFGEPWDQGTAFSWIGDADQPFIQVIAQDGQWVFQIELYHSNDYGLRGGNEPALAFTEDELKQWFVETYLPQVNQTINDRIAEVK